MPFFDRLCLDVLHCSKHLKESFCFYALIFTDAVPVDVFPASGSRVSEGVSPDHMSRDAPETGVDVAHIHGDRVDVLQGDTQEIDMTLFSLEIDR